MFMEELDLSIHKCIRISTFHSAYGLPLGGQRRSDKMKFIFSLQLSELTGGSSDRYS